MITKIKARKRAASNPICIAPDILLWYLPAVGYVTENQTPGNWQMSQSFKTVREAMAAYGNGLIVWTDEESEHN